MTASGFNSAQLDVGSCEFWHRFRRVMLRTRAVWPSCHPIWATFTHWVPKFTQSHTHKHTQRGLTQTCLHGSTKKKKKKNTHTRRLIFCVANKSQRVFCFVYCLRGGDRGAVMTEYVLACTRTFRTITPVCSYSPCPSAPRRAAVTLPRLSTRRQPEELKPRTWHLVCSTTAAEELLSKCTRSDVKYTRTFTSLVFAKAREGVSFAWLKGLVRRFFFFFFF